MAFKPGRREKLAGGTIIILVGIALLHYFVFQRKHAQLSVATSQYSEVKNRYDGMKKPNVDILKQFEAETAQKEAEFKKAVENLKPCPPDYYGDFSPEGIQRLRTDFVDKVKQINALRDKCPDIKWTFLNEQGWGFDEKLPDPVRKGQIVIGDLIDRIQEHDRLIGYLTNPNEIAFTKREYLQFLFQLGINMDRMQNPNYQFKEFFGEIVPRLALINHALLILDEVKKDPDSALTLDQMLYYLRPEFEMENFYDNVVMHETLMQLDGLIDVLKIACDSNLEEVVGVSILNRKNVKEKAEKGKDGQPTPTPTPIQDMMMDPMMMMMMMGEGGPGMPGMPPGMPGMPGMPGAPTPEPEKFVAIATGYKLRFQAQNNDAIQFLFNISNSNKPYTIDDITVYSLEDGRVDVTTTIAAYIWIPDICK